MFQNR